MDSLDAYELVVTEPSGEERVERYASSAAVNRRWLQIKQSFEHTGWWGPLPLTKDEAARRPAVRASTRKPRAAL